MYVGGVSQSMSSNVLECYCGRSEILIDDLRTVLFVVVFVLPPPENAVVRKQ